MNALLIIYALAHGVVDPHPRTLVCMNDCYEEMNVISMLNEQYKPTGWQWAASLAVIPSKEAKNGTP